MAYELPEAINVFTIPAESKYVYVATHGNAERDEAIEVFETEEEARAWLDTFPKGNPYGESNNIFMKKIGGGNAMRMTKSAAKR